MFNFFHKKKEIVLDCFTDNPIAYHLAPVNYANRSIPEWWNTLPTGKNRTHKNMKFCYGFVELYKKGLILESWTDFDFKINQNEINFKYASGNPPVQHNAAEYNFAYSEFNHLKLNSPWIFREKTGVKFIFKSDIWSQLGQPYHVLDGIVEFEYNATTSVNIMIEKGHYDFSIKVGDPLAHIIPLIDENVRLKIKNHLVDKNELNKLFLNYVGFNRPLYDLIKLAKNKKEKLNKCPFK